MPVYDYKCNGKLQHEFEIVLTFKQIGEPQTCPKCKASARRVIKVMSPVVFKGNDWPSHEGREF